MTDESTGAPNETGKQQPIAPAAKDVPLDPEQQQKQQQQQQNLQVAHDSPQAKDAQNVAADAKRSPAETAAKAVSGNAATDPEQGKSQEGKQQAANAQNEEQAAPVAAAPNSPKVTRDSYD